MAAWPLPLREKNVPTVSRPKWLTIPKK